MKRVENWFPPSAFGPLAAGPRPAPAIHRSSSFAPRRAAPVPAFYILHFAFLICLSPGAFAVTPYEAIVGRNVFGLKPPTVVPTVVEEPRVPAPKIRLQGLTTILGRRQVLFKASLPAKPGEAAREQASVLSEGDREGEITVLEINEVTGAVKFNNYGYVMTLNMKDDADKPAAGAVAAGVPQPGVIPPPGLPMAPPMSSPPPGVPMPRNNPAIPSNIPARSLRTSSAEGVVPSGGLGAGVIPESPARSNPVLPHETQEIMIEVNRLRRQQAGDPTAKLLPPTSITPSKDE